MGNQLLMTPPKQTMAAQDVEQRRSQQVASDQSSNAPSLASMRRAQSKGGSMRRNDKHQ